MERSVRRRLCGFALATAVGIGCVGGWVGSVLAQAAAPALTLEEVVSLAQDQGIDARTARGARDAERWRDRAFNARLLPQVRLGGTVPSLNQSIEQVIQPDGKTSFVRKRERYSSLDLTIQQAVPQVGGQLQISSGLSRLDLLGSEEMRQWQAEPLVVGWSQDLLSPRRVRWEQKEQAGRKVASEQRYHESLEQVAASATNAYFDLYAAGLSEANAVANAAVNDTLYQLSRGRFEVGRIGENDLLQSELALLRARSSAEAARIERERAAAALRIAIDLPDGAPIAIAPPPRPLALVIDTTVVVNEAIRNQSRLTDQELRLLSARRDLAAARLARGPSATLTALVGLDQTARDLDGAYRDPLDRQQVVLTVDVPLWLWGAGKAEVEAARVDLENQRMQEDLLKREIAQESLHAAQRLRIAGSQLDLAAKADSVAARRFEVAKNRYVVGKIDIADLYLAQSEKDGALLSYVEALRGYWLAYYELRRLTLYDFAQGRPIAEGR